MVSLRIKDWLTFYLTYKIYKMDKQQITRIPLKYWPILNTLSNEIVWKIFKDILWWNETLNDIESMYFDLMMVDINNINKSAWDWVKGKEYGILWWRPKGIKEITPQGLESKTPRLDKTSIDKNIDDYQEFKTKWNNIPVLWIAWKWLPKIMVDNPALINEYKKKRNIYDFEQIRLWLQNYCRYIQWLPKDDKWYYLHRFNAIEFLGRKGWLDKFINMTMPD